MKSLKELYKIGRGPSSSHTLGPQRACQLFIDEYGLCSKYKVELYGSLSLTGKGHSTDEVITDTLKPARVEIEFKDTWEEKFPNGFYIKGYNSHNKCIASWTVFSVGGGSIEIKEKELRFNDEIYLEKSFSDIKDVLKKNNMSLVDYVFDHEEDVEDYLYLVLAEMLSTVDKGLEASGTLPGKLQLKRSAKSLKMKADALEDGVEKDKLKLMAYAYAANEENAAGRKVVTAPTLGSCGVLAAIMTYGYRDLNISRTKLVEALAVAGVFGNLVKQNATISGAIGGCQAEVGTACAMASAALAYLNDLNLKQIEYAAEIGMEHNLGLTCDPVDGYVMIPCIERNAMATLRAIDAMTLSKFMTPIKGNKISFDMIVNTMNYTGKKIAYELRETGLGGLALEFDHE